MGERLSLSFKIILIDGEKDSISEPLINNLLHFTEHHHHIESKSLFIETLLNPHLPGELVLFYDEINRLVGYTRVYQHQLEIKANLITIFSSKSYNSPTANTLPTAARLGLTHIMKYKLAHPEEELVYFSTISTVHQYHFLSQMSNTVYPRPGADVPVHILTLVNFLKDTFQWTSSTTHPMLIRSELPSKHLLQTESIQDAKLAHYFHTLQPEFEAGFDLLVCVPLNLGNISYGLRQLMGETNLRQEAMLDLTMII